LQLKAIEMSQPTNHNGKRKKGIYLQASMEKNDRKAYLFTFLVSAVVFIAVVILGKVELKVDLGFDVHLFARANALINTFVALLLLSGLWAAKDKRYATHKKLMLWAIGLSVLFLLSYICHHLFAGSTEFGNENTGGITKSIYYFILFTHIPLAGIILPFILISSYRALIGEYEKHKKLVKFTWPLWFYVAVTGVIVYLMISPYYS
jgi:putative membrane protein